MQLQGDFAELIQFLMKDFRFCHGIRVAAFTMYKCLLYWKCFEHERTTVFDQLIQILRSATEVLPPLMIKKKVLFTNHINSRARDIQQHLSTYKTQFISEFFFLHQKDLREFQQNVYFSLLLFYSLCYSYKITSKMRFFVIQ